jgi:hypothetical protein
MPTNYESVRSYLIGLGWKIDESSEKKFENALKRSAVMTERYAKGAIKDFTMVGGAFAAAAAGVVAGTVAMATSVANQDLQYQLLARRMFMTTDVVRKMDFATKALGVTLPEIIFGPPELQGRYHTLIQDETAMLKLLGGDQGESAFRRIRDIEFQFTRLEPALKIFAMKLTEDVINKMFGGTESLEMRMKNFVDWFESPAGFVKLSDQFSNVLAPAILKAGHALGWLWDKMVGVAGFVSQWSDNTKGITTSPSPSGNKYEEEGRKQFGPYGLGRMKELLSGHNYIQEIIDAAKKYNIPPSLLMAIGGKESNLNPFAPMGGKGEIGEFQLLPSTIEQLKKLGIITDPYDPSQNILGGAYWLQSRPGKTWEDKVKSYNGSGAAADRYRDDVMKRWHSDPLYQPQSYHSNMGGVTINIAGTNAHPEQIQRAVRDGMDEYHRKRAVQMFARSQGTYA